MAVNVNPADEKVTPLNLEPMPLRLLNPVVLPDFRLKRREGLKTWASLAAVIRLETCF